MRRYAVHGGDVCLRAGRICASTATGKDTADLGMDKTPGQCDGRPNRNAFGQVLCGYPVPPPWDINFGDGTVRHGRCAGNRKNTAGGTSGTCSAPPKVLMHSQLRKTAFASGPRVQRAPGVPHALSQEGGNADDDGAPAPQTMEVMTHVWKRSGCLTVESANGAQAPRQVLIPGLECAGDPASAAHRRGTTRWMAGVEARP